MSFLLQENAREMLGPSAFLATVVNVKDPQNRNQVQVKLFVTSGVDDQDGLVWARVAVPVAGGQRGTFFIPNVGDEVIIVFLSGDPRFAVVIGSLWNGRDKAPETLGGSGDSVDRWTITGKAGTRIAIVEESASTATISLTTPGNLSGTMTDSGGGSIEFSNASNTSVKIDSAGVTITTLGKVTLNAGTQLDVTAQMVNVSSAFSMFSGTIQCDKLLTTTVVAATYTPGAGNVW